MKVQMTVVRCEKVTTDDTAAKAPRVKVVASTGCGSWTMHFPLDFAQHVYVGQSLTVNVEVG